MSEKFDISILFTESFLASSAIAIIIIGAILRKIKLERFYLYFSAVVMLGAFLYSLNDFGSPHTYTFSSMVASDDIKQVFKIIIIGLSFMTLLLLVGSANKYPEVKKFEFSSLILLSVFGSLIILSSNNLITLYLGLETQSLCLYVLAAFSKNDNKSSEAGVKYFVLGSIASIVLLFGMSFMYGYSGTIYFTEMKKVYSSLSHLDSNVEIPIGFIIGFVLVLIGLLFKAASFPFHVWAPDVYQGSQLPVTAFFSIVPKITSILIITDILLFNFAIWKDAWKSIIIFVSVASMFVGALGAMAQSNIKRLLAYSSISNVGFILVVLISNTQDALSSIIIYVLIYGTMNLGVFALLGILQKEREDYDINLLKGLGSRHPMLSFAFAVIFLSMAGIPPFAGFFAKFFVVKSLINSQFYTLATITVIASVIGCYYYLKLVKIMYFEESLGKNSKLDFSAELVFVATSAVTINLLLVFFPSSIAGFSAIKISLLP